MENVLVSHASAFRYWTMSRSAPHPDQCRLERAVASEELSLKIPYARIYEFAQNSCPDGLLAGSDGLLDVLLDRRFGRRGILGCRVHTWDGPLPFGSVCRMPSGLFVVSPEMAFLGLASSLTLQETIVCGSALCSTYQLDHAQGSLGAGGIPHSLSTRARLYAFLLRVEGRKGSRRALQALRWVVEGAASEREVELASLLFTPRKHGGSGLPRAYLNYRINLGNVARNMADRSFCIGDFVWPEKRLVLEYDSDAYHASPRAMQRDARRRNALLYEGYEVVTCTNDIFASQSAMAALVAQLEAKLYPRGRRTYAVAPDVQARLKLAARNIPRGVI